MDDIAKRVLAEAGDCEQFWRLSEAERLIWMLQRAGELGKALAVPKLLPRCRPRQGRERKRWKK